MSVDMRSELCKTCAHTKVCMKDKNVAGDHFVAGHPLLFDNENLFEKFKEWEKAGFPCDDYLAETRWIPVSEGLPEKSGDYLCTIQSGEHFSIMICIFYSIAKRWIPKCYGNHDNVIAWMPLPDPYKEEP